MVETAGGAQRLVFSQVLNAQVWELEAGIFDKVSENAFIVISNQDYLAESRDFGDRFEGMVNDRVAGDLKQWLTLV